MRVVLASLLLLAAFTADARMYRWVDPGSGNPQLSGVPPTWYRGSDGGPRVLVYVNGNLIDDTAIEVSAEFAAVLRAEAFRALEEERRLASLAKLEEQAQRKRLEQERQQREESRARQEAPPSEGQASAEGDQKPVAETPAEIDEATVKQLKTIIEQWDQLNAGVAK